MKRKKQKKLATKIASILSIVLVLSFTVLTVIVVVSSGNSIADRQESEMRILSQTNAEIAKEFMEIMVHKQDVLIDVISELDGVTDEERIVFLKNILERSLKSEEDALSFFYVSPKTEDAPNGITVYATDSAVGIELSQNYMLDASAFAAQEKNLALSVKDPYKKVIGNKEYMVVTVLQPIIDQNGNFAGVVGTDIDTNVLLNTDFETGGYKSFSNKIVCGHKSVIIDKENPENIGKQFVDVTSSIDPTPYLEVLENGEEKLFVTEFKNGDSYYSSCIPFYITGSDTVWISITNISQKEFTAPMMTQTIITALACIIILLIVDVTVYFVIIRRLRPIKEVELAAEHIKNGVLDIDINYTGNDEIGALAENMRESTKILKGYIDDIAMVMAYFADGNFVIPPPTRPFEGDFKVIENDVITFVERICVILEQISAAAGQVATGSTQLSTSAQSLSDGATEQASAVEELTATVTELSERVNHTAQNARLAKEKSEMAGTAVTQSNEQMQSMLDAMNEINNKSVEISKIVKTIEDIAFQTNILALNAAVEAARAGASGKGFAVVAEEVRNLAQKSGDAAKNTTSLIGETVAAVSHGMKVADATAGKMQSVIDVAAEATSLIVEIASDSIEQATAIGQLHMGMDQISSVVELNSAASEESAAASEELSEQARVLDSLIEKFKIK